MRNIFSTFVVKQTFLQPLTFFVQTKNVINFITELCIINLLFCIIYHNFDYDNRLFYFLNISIEYIIQF